MAFTHYFSTSMSGCPAPGTSAGNLTAFLDACLVNGFGSVTANSVIVLDGVATVTVSSGHGMVNVEGLGPVIAVSGATDDADLNGTFRSTVVTTTILTYPCQNVANGTYSAGPIALKRAPLGWAMEWTGTNERVYRPPVGIRHRLWVSDTGTTLASVRGRISSLSISDTSNQFPTTAQRANSYFGKTTSEWVLIGNDRLFYLRTGDSALGNLYVFGDYVSYATGLLNTCVLGPRVEAGTSYAYTDWLTQPNFMPTPFGLYLARDLSDAGVPHGGGIFFPGYSTNEGFVIGSDDNNVLSFNLAAPLAGHKFYGPVQVRLNDKTLVGELPGMYAPLTGRLDHNSKYSGSALNGKVLLGLQFFGSSGSSALYNTGSAAIDLKDWY